jgi:hypothetical protein
MSREKYPHYYKHCPYEYIDVYRVLDLFGVSDQAVGHAIKKLLVAGERGHKNIEKDIKEAIVTLERRVEMWEEDKNESVNFKLTDESIRNELNTFDAVVWGKAFCKIHPQVDLDLAISWFANALMRGYDQRYWESDEYKNSIKEVLEPGSTDKHTVNYLTEREEKESEYAKCTVDDIYKNHDWGDGFNFAKSSEGYSYYNPRVDFTVDKNGYFNFNKPTDSLGPLPKAVEKVPELTEEEKQLIMKRHKYLGDLYEVK